MNFVEIYHLKIPELKEFGRKALAFSIFFFLNETEF